MRRLILMRHAKSAWDDPDMDDADRPLNLRGRLAAVLMGAWLAEQGLRPDHVLLSPSRRTRETWARLGPGGGFTAPEDEVPALYLAPPEVMLAVLQAVPPAAGTVLMLGHEPGCGGLLRRLSDGAEGAGCRRAHDKFPTAGVAVLELDGDWRDAAFGAARFTRFAMPKDLV